MQRTIFCYKKTRKKKCTAKQTEWWANVIGGHLYYRLPLFPEPVMAVKYLNLLPATEENCLLYALSSHEKAVRLVWSINRETVLDFRRTEDIIVKRQLKDCHFIQYICSDDVYEVNYVLFKNQCDGAHLIPELKMIPYFIQVMYNESLPDEELFSRLNKPEAGQLCFEIKPDQLKPVTRNMLNL